MRRERREFSREFKQEAVRRIELGQTIAAVARELDVRGDMLRRWRRELTAAPTPEEAFRGHGKLTSQDEEIRQLKRQLALVTEEREILKKATAFFAKGFR